MVEEIDEKERRRGEERVRMVSTVLRIECDRFARE